MLRTTIYTKVLIIAFFVAVAHIAMGAFSGVDDKTKNKYSLKNINSISKNYSLSSLHISSFKFAGSQDLFTQKSADGVEINSMIRLQNGNTTYVYPYKYVVKMPKFKTPTAPAHL
jgi:hypothetical protein